MGMLISLYVCMLYRYIQLVITKTSSTKMARAGSSDNPTRDPIATSAHAHLIKQSVWRWDVQTIAQILFMSLTNAALLAVCFFLVLTSIHFSIFSVCVSVCPEIFIV